jgi:hypothetical protein
VENKIKEMRKKTIGLTKEKKRRQQMKINIIGKRERNKCKE